MRTILFSMILGVCWLLTACSNPPIATPTADDASASQPVAKYRTMTLDDFAGVVDSPAHPYTVVNVHIPYEGEVANTDLFISYNNVEALMSALPDKNAPIILYCRSGRMSDIAAHALVEQGYTNVWDVPGGMNDWTKSGRELIVKD